MIVLLASRPHLYVYWSAAPHCLDVRSFLFLLFAWEQKLKLDSKMSEEGGGVDFSAERELRVAPNCRLLSCAQE